MREGDSLVDRLSSARFQVVHHVQVVGEDVAESVTPLELWALVHVAVSTDLREGEGLEV